MLTPAIEEVQKHLSGLAHEPRRLFHGRGVTVPEYEFLVIDWYPPLLLVTLYEDQNPDWLQLLADEIKAILGTKLKGIVVQDRSKVKALPRIIYGSAPEHLVIEEDGLRFAIAPLARQNIGFFPDMASGRQLLRSIANGKKVLNLFAYTCSLSVAAIAGGADQVVNLDMNRNLLERGRENHRLNNHDLRRVSFLPYNLFKSFGRLQKLGPFDLVIIDPPYLQKGSFKAERDWPKILRKLPSLLSRNGEIIAAVSAPELGRRFLHNQVKEHLPDADLISGLTAGSDFPEADEDKGLHIQHYRI